MMPSWLTLLSLYLGSASLFPFTCLAQDNKSSSNGGPTATSTTSSAPTQTHTIQVGLADHKFRPEVTEAKIGDTIEFTFYPANHSVVRAEYGYPCIPYEMTGSNKAGFFTGFHPVDKVLDDPPKSTLTINDTDPIFFYCSAPGSCLHYGMVGAINPNTSTSIDTQHQLALDSAYMLNPGEPFPAESPLPSSNPASTPVPGDSHTEKKGLGTGAIAGIVIAGLSVVVLAALLFFFWGRTKSLKDEVDRKESTVTRRISPSSSATMLEVGRRDGNGEGLGIYQHYTQTPATTYPSPRPQQQQQQQQQKNTSPATSPTDYPAYYPATYIYSPSPAAPAPAANITNPHHQQTATSPHHSTDGSWYSYSYPFPNRPLPQPPNTATSPVQNNTAAAAVDNNHHSFSHHHNHNHNHVNHGTVSPSPSLAHTSNTSTTTTGQEDKFSPYAQHQHQQLQLQQQQQQQQQHFLLNTSDPAPSYFETVHRPGPVHVNGRLGPAEMEAGSTNTDEGARASVAMGVEQPKLEKKEGERGGEKMQGERERETPRWEEVVDVDVEAGRKNGGEGRLF